MTCPRTRPIHGLLNREVRVARVADCPAEVAHTDTARCRGRACDSPDLPPVVERARQDGLPVDPAVPGEIDIHVSAQAARGPLDGYIMVDAQYFAPVRAQDCDLRACAAHAPRDVGARIGCEDDGSREASRGRRTEAYHDTLAGPGAEVE